VKIHGEYYIVVTEIPTAVDVGFVRNWLKQARSFDLVEYHQFATEILYPFHVHRPGPLFTSPSRNSTAFRIDRKIVNIQQPMETIYNADEMLVGMVFSRVQMVTKIPEIQLQSSSAASIAPGSRAVSVNKASVPPSMTLDSFPPTTSFAVPSPMYSAMYPFPMPFYHPSQQMTASPTPTQGVNSNSQLLQIIAEAMKVQQAVNPPPTATTQVTVATPTAAAASAPQAPVAALNANRKRRRSKELVPEGSAKARKLDDDPDAEDADRNHQQSDSSSEEADEADSPVMESTPL